MYKVISENLTNLGGPMGSEYTFNNWTKYFKSLPRAKAVCESDYADHSNKPFMWIQTEDGLRSNDLGFVMYHIVKIESED